MVGKMDGLKYLYKLRRRKRFTKFIGTGTIVMPSFDVELRSGNIDGRISIGENSVLGCHITLEREVGNVFIGDNTYISAGTHLICAEQIEVGSNVLIAWGCNIVDHDSHSLNWLERADDVRNWREGLMSQGKNAASKLKNWRVVPMAPIHIGNKVWIGFNAIVLKGITIGEGAVVAAASVVTKDVPAWTLVAGNPARPLKELPH
jgi:acetyltransferase-like isoleucine patch superfamily enzyme